MCVREREYEYVCVISTLLSPASVVHRYMDEGLTWGVGHMYGGPIPEVQAL